MSTERIVCGDFNQPPSTWLTDRHAVTPSPAIATYPTSKPVECIDYAIFIGLNFEASPHPCLASDHLAIVITTGNALTSSATCADQKAEGRQA